MSAKKLNAGLAAAIRFARANETPVPTQAELARRYGCSLTTIRLILAQVTYRDVQTGIAEPDWDAPETDLKYAQLEWDHGLAPPGTPRPTLETILAARRRDPLVR